MTSANDSAVEASQRNPSTCFSCTRLNSTTFLIVEDDQWSETPFIYAKLYDSVLVLVDTGCGGAARDSSVELTSLRQFIETYPVADNDGRPLNPGGKKDYSVVCTHCHYDHIGGIAQFTDDKSSIWASSNNKGFILDDLPTTSLCRFVGMETPRYAVTKWASDGQSITHGSEATDLGLFIYHTPGHTPDELAIWDPDERVIFVGDSLYEWAPIIFPLEGDLEAYNATLFKLKDLIKTGNHAGTDRVKMACGHNTSAADAEEFVDEVEAFFSKVRRGLVEPVDQGEARGVKLVGYEREDGRISFLGPKHLFEGALVGHCPV
ncbi:unnamed protein product [Discula destructiva]